MEIKKIMEENNLEEIFDVMEEACHNDCVERSFFNWATGKIDYIRSPKTTSLW